MCILHTVVPLEIVLAGLDFPGVPGRGKQDAPAPGTRNQAVPLGGARFVELDAGPEGPVIRRLVSPLPADYLDPRLQPGTPFPWHLAAADRSEGLPGDGEAARATTAPGPIAGRSSLI